MLPEVIQRRFECFDIVAEKAEASVTAITEQTPDASPTASVARAACVIMINGKTPGWPGRLFAYGAQALLLGYHLVIALRGNTEPAYKLRSPGYASALFRISSAPSSLSIPLVFPLVLKTFRVCLNRLTSAVFNCFGSFRVVLPPFTHIDRMLFALFFGSHVLTVSRKYVIGRWVAA